MIENHRHGTFQSTNGQSDRVWLNTGNSTALKGKGIGKERDILGKKFKDSSEAKHWQNCARFVVV